MRLFQDMMTPRHLGAVPRQKARARRSSRHSNNSSTCCHSNNSNASQRSSSGGGGGGGGKCLRYLEADMARLHESRRPVVVSFRRPASNSSLLTMDTSTTTASSSEVYVSLEAALRNPRHGQRKSRILLNESYLGVICKHPKPSILKDMIRKDNLPDRKMFRFSTPSPSSSLSHDTSLGVTCEDNFTLLPYPKLNISEAASFESVVTHVDVPLPGSGYVNEGSKTNDPSSDPKQINFPKIEDIEIFQEQRLMIQSSLKRRRQLKVKLVKNGKNPSHTTSCSNIDKDTIIVARSNDASLSNHKLLNERTSPTMTRSCTMPCVTSLERELTPDESSRRMDIINEEFERKWSVDAGRGEVDLRPNGSRVDILPEELCERISNVVGHVDVHGYAMLMEDVNLSLEEKTSCNNLNNKAQNSDFLGNRDTSLNYPGLESTDDSRNENTLHDTPSKRRAGESQVGFHLKDLENCNNDLLSKRYKKRKSEEVDHPSRQTCEVEGFHQKESILFNDRVLVCYEAEPEDPESKVIRQSPASPELQSYQIKCYFPKAINPRRPRSCFDLRDYLNYPANLDRNGIYNKTINVSSPKLFAYFLSKCYITELQDNAKIILTHVKWLFDSYPAPSSHLLRLVVELAPLEGRDTGLNKERKAQQHAEEKKPKLPTTIMPETALREQQCSLYLVVPPSSPAPPMCACAQQSNTTSLALYEEVGRLSLSLSHPMSLFLLVIDNRLSLSLSHPMSLFLLVTDNMLSLSLSHPMSLFLLVTDNRLSLSLSHPMSVFLLPVLLLIQNPLFSFQLEVQLTPSFSLNGTASFSFSRSPIHVPQTTVTDGVTGDAVVAETPADAHG
uniref:Uncharacterized protein n=1 Tax=Timema cristinae TaxID=61476 RepID=A0A7R9CQ28_TIMCR|nr:unnamed protein product [Timema cristinae]